MRSQRRQMPLIWSGFLSLTMVGVVVKSLPHRLRYSPALRRQRWTQDAFPAEPLTMNSHQRRLFTPQSLKASSVLARGRAPDSPFTLSSSRFSFEGCRADESMPRMDAEALNLTLSPWVRLV
jgi:hypothetical protein